jgi:general secretion pathway protein L
VDSFDLIMPDRLLLRLHADGSLAWLAQDAQGRALSASNVGGPPGETIARAQRIVVLVPSESVLLLDTPVVSSRRSQLLNAVPFALEDQLVSPVEELHFALAERFSAARIAVAVVARATLREWIDVLAAHGIRADAIIPETLALPVSENTASVVIEDSRSLLRWGPVHACACATQALPEWLGIVAPSTLEVYDFRQAPRLSLATPVTHYHERQRDALGFFAQQLSAEPALNLLQGQFAPSHRHMPAQRLWQRAALLAAAAIILAFVYSGCDYLRLRHESDRLDLAMHEALHASLPEFDQVAGDPRQLMESALTRMRGGSDAGGLLRVLGQIAPVLARTTRVSVKGMEYRNATLELGLRAPDVPTLDLVREQMANLQGLKAEVTAANTSDNGVDGRVRISGAGP